MARSKQQHPVRGLRVLITGASSGIGRAAATSLAAQGAVVLLVARRADELAEVAAEITAAGGTAHAHPCDITDDDAVAALLAEVGDQHPQVDVLVNNAGRSIRRPVRESLDRLHDYERTMAVNYLAAVGLTLGVLPGMLAAGAGHVVNVSSVSTIVGAPRFSAYVSSKAALNAFTKVVAGELQGTGVTFTTVHVPLVRTAMSAASGTYDRFPQLTAEQGGDLLVRAVVDRPAEVKSLGWKVATVVAAVAPSITDRVVRSSETYEKRAR